MNNNVCLKKNLFKLSLLKNFHSNIVHGDSLTQKPFQQLFPNIQEKADILITDPPYCLLERKRPSGDLRDPKSIKRKTLDFEEVPRFENLNHYRQFTEKWIENSLSYGLKGDSPMIIWTNFLGKGVIIDICKSKGYNLLGEYLWGKISSDSKAGSWDSNKNELLLRAYEVALIFVKSPKINSKSEYITVDGLTRPRSLFPWFIATGYHDAKATTQLSHDHPCHKPISVIEPLLHVWTKPNAIILDPFVGSGGIGLAVKKVDGDRHYRGIELLNNWVKRSKDCL